ncbi:unnamed protein product (macronuclear) [Paramecium tetraurelia]|uniref:RING-type E3 ubiquitin transferase n=1 Tax=Paramecium tetraurelia TaxID=5888 RepID=A0E1N5_PARTE|nr:uncharacterized protein GSPATT00022373001 [Paramecium tetraurelia]CAK89202.1 unnamed protein product [Paramecium tetraurelia]|eukprot:XP_001456599.1 hypothetical protein (macronuclear) [Paramecium tetraurelia strain d4-2]
MGNCCDTPLKQNPPKIESLPQVTQSLSETEIKEQSQKYKEEGNQYMQQKLFKEAIIAYTQAINLYNKESIYYSNRAVAYRTIEDYVNVKKDALQALQLDNKNVRAYFILGTVHLILGQQDKCLIQAQEGVNFLIQAQKHIDLKPQLKESINYNYSQGLILKAKLEKSENYKEFLNLKEKLTKFYGKIINLNKLSYPGTKEHYVPNSVEYYTCVITQEAMCEPVLLSSGHTYEKCSINECIRVNGPYDPATRQVIWGNQIPNIQLKSAIVDYQNNTLEFQ